jgi:hypothetical protein
LRIVGHQPEPKLIAFMQIANAAAASGSAGVDGSSNSPLLAKVDAYASISPAAMRTDRARSATQAQPARTSSGRETEPMTKSQIQIREAVVEDAPEIARLLHDFNTEYEEETPPVPELIRHAERMLREGEMTVLLAGDGPDGLALLRFRPSVWTERQEAYML